MMNVFMSGENSNQFSFSYIYFSQNYLFEAQFVNLSLILQNLFSIK